MHDDRYYKESHKILGNTYGMLVLQDFEAVTPNLLARTIETVEGGGLVVLLLKTMSSLRQLYNMTMVRFPPKSFLMLRTLLTFADGPWCRTYTHGTAPHHTTPSSPALTNVSSSLSALATTASFSMTN